MKAHDPLTACRGGRRRTVGQHRAPLNLSVTPITRGYHA
jgi:hypothetical protein